MAKLNDMPRGFGIDPAVFMRPAKPPAAVESDEPDARLSGPSRNRAARDRLIAGIDHGFEVEGENEAEPKPRPSIMLISLTVGLMIAGATLALEWF